jgi:hypothetical protein
MRNLTFARFHITANSMLCLTIFVCEEENFFLKLTHYLIKATDRASGWYHVLSGTNLGTLVLPCSLTKCSRLAACCGNQACEAQTTAGKQGDKQGI